MLTQKKTFISWTSVTERSESVQKAILPVIQLTASLVTDNIVFIQSEKLFDQDLLSTSYVYAGAKHIADNASALEIIDRQILLLIRIHLHTVFYA